MGWFLSPDPLGLEHVKKLLLNPQTLNKYAYADNNPLDKTDLGGFLTIVVPGTNYDSAQWSGQTGNAAAVLQSVSATFQEKAVPLLWGGGDSFAARAAGAKQLQALIATAKPGEVVNVVGLSHGGNVALLSTVGASRKIDNLITVGTPATTFESGHDRSNIGFWGNVYNPHDPVQISGGSDLSSALAAGVAGRIGQDAENFAAQKGWEEFGSAGRSFSDANANVSVDAPGTGAAAHTNLWNDRDTRNIWLNGWTSGQN